MPKRSQALVIDIVCGIIIDDDEFVLRLKLPENAANGAIKILRLIVNGDQNTN